MPSANGVILVTRPTDNLGWVKPTAAEVLPEPPPAATAPSRPTPPSEKVYDFQPGVEYRANVAIGVPLDLALQPDERIRHTAKGDCAPQELGDEQPPWDVVKEVFGPPGQEQPRV
jgi:hypothetical protein